MRPSIQQTARSAGAPPALAALRLIIEERGGVAASIRNLACCELGSAHILGKSLHLAPTIDDQVVLGQQMVRHLERFDTLASIHEALGEGDLLLAATKRVKGVPAPHTWVELVVAQFLLGEAARVHWSSSHWPADLGLSVVLGRMLADEREQDALPAATLRDLFGRRLVRSREAQADLERWLRVTLAFVSASAGRGGKGFLRGDDGDVIRTFLEGLVPALSGFGLHLPNQRAKVLGIRWPMASIPAGS